MAVRNGVIAEVRPVVALRRPSFRAGRPTGEGSIFELFGGAEGQLFTVIVDAAVRVTHPVLVASDVAVRVQRPFVLLADLHQSMGGRVNLLTDGSARVCGGTTIHADARVRIGLRVTRQADLYQHIGVGAAVSADAALTVYRVILHEDHLILI